MVKLLQSDIHLSGHSHLEECCLESIIAPDPRGGKKDNQESRVAGGSLEAGNSALP